MSPQPCTHSIIHSCDFAVTLFHWSLETEPLEHNLKQDASEEDLIFNPALGMIVTIAIRSEEGHVTTGYAIVT